MLFSSLEFLYLFLPLTVVAYFATPKGGKNYVLLIASLVFYGIAQPKLLPLMIAVSLADYAFGLAVWNSAVKGKQKRANILCATAVILNASVLFFFKYLDALLSLFGIRTLGIELPVGISFYTFQAMSYVIDIRRRAARAQKDPLLFLTYVSLFPQLVAGPIVRYSEIDSSLAARRHSIADIACGTRLFTVGLCKKLLLANGAGECFERMVRLSREGGSVLSAWLGVIFFAFQIYFDFSGYSDMACGLGKIFGFNFPQNFNYPYISRSITEFWRRWHITLSSYFREYVYIPLGGNRRGRGRMYINLLIVWLLTGLWHGAGVNFLLWGLYFFVLLSLEKAFLLKLLDRIPKILSHTYALIFILLGWLIFACDGAVMSASEGMVYLGQTVGIGTPLATNDSLFELLRALPYLAVMALASTPLVRTLTDRLQLRRPIFLRSVLNALTLLALIICTAYLADSAYNPFLYFKF